MQSVLYDSLGHPSQLNHFYKQLQRDNAAVQITVTNHTDTQRPVSLWGANRKIPLTIPMVLEEQQDASLDVKGQPMAMVYNPKNDAFYVVNQLEDSVVVISTQGELMTTIALGESLHPGVISPVAIAVNTKASHADYGEVAVACSVSNEVVFIAASYQITKRIATDKRPVAVVFNPVEVCYFVAHLLSDSLFKLCPQKRINQLPSVKSPRSLGVDEALGDVYVFSSVTKYIQVFDVYEKLKGRIGPVQTDSVQFMYHPLEKTMYVLSDTLGELAVIEPTALVYIVKCKLGNFPVAISYNPHKALIYVATRDNQKLVLIDSKHQIMEQLAPVDFNLGLAISSKADVLAFSDSKTGKVTVIAHSQQPTVTVNEEYEQIREDFQHQPAMIRHVKMVASGEAYIHTLRISEASVSGLETSQSIGLSNHRSPQNFGNVSEVFDLEGHLIDGHVTWHFKIQPFQQISFLIYYKQFKMYAMLPRASVNSTAVPMLEDSSVSWHDNSKEKLGNVTTY